MREAGRIGRKALIATAGFLLVLAGLFAWYFEPEASETDPEQILIFPDPETPWASEPPPDDVADAEPAPPPTIPLAPIDPNHTPFQRRLAIAPALRALLDDANAGRIGYEAAVARVRNMRQHLLVADRHGVLVRQFGDRPTYWDGHVDSAVPLLQRFVNRDLDVDHLHLVDGVPSDPYGEQQFVRMWFRPGGRIDRASFNAADSLIRRLMRLEDVQEGTGGFDVLATPDLGASIFSRACLPWWADGAYFPADELCLVRTGDKASPRALRYELARAWIRRRHPTWKTPFVIDGLASYLSWLDPDDATLRVPPERFAGRGFELFPFSMAELRLDRLLYANTWEYHSLRHVATITAEAAFASLDTALIANALHGDDEALLLRALGELDAWSLDTHTETPRTRSEDVPIDHAHPAALIPIRGWPPELLAFAEEVEFKYHPAQISIWREAAKLARRPMFGSLADGPSAAFLGRLVSANRLAFVAEKTEAMTGDFVLYQDLGGASAPSVRAVARPDRETYVAEWVERLDKALDVRQYLIAQTLERRPIADLQLPDADTVSRLIPDPWLEIPPLLQWLREGADGAESVVICLASRDKRRRRLASRWLKAAGILKDHVLELPFLAIAACYADFVSFPRTRRPKNVLIVDLGHYVGGGAPASDERSDANLLAAALALGWADTTTVACWDPQAKPK